MPLAIARITKLKQGNIAAAAQHSRRQRETPNADPAKANLCLMDADADMALEDLVRQRIGDQPIRKNAVLCVEMLLSASPEYFRSNNPGEAGYWEAEPLERFQYAAQQWLTQTYGDRIVRAELHLDEATPHVHAYLVPIDGRGRLNCYGLFGDREKLRQWQDSYAKALEALEPLGIERGIRGIQGSRATHTAIKEYYAAVMQEAAAMDVATMQHQLADRPRLLKENRELELTARHLERQLAELQSQVQRLSQERERYQQRLQQVRSIPLVQVAAELGLKCDSPQGNRWTNVGHDIQINDSQFYDWATLSGGGGAIDLVMQVQGGDFRAAVVWLRDDLRSVEDHRFGEGEALQATTESVEEIWRSTPRQPFQLPEADARYWQQGRDYLTKTLKLPGKLLDRLHQQGLVYAGKDGRLVFLQRDLRTGVVTGASLYDWATVDWSVAEGSQGERGGFYLGKGEQAIVLDSPIEVMSKWVLDQPEPQGLYVSGAEGQVLPQGVRVWPRGESWNQDLQEELRVRFERGQQGREGVTLD